MAESVVKGTRVEMGSDNGGRSLDGKGAMFNKKGHVSFGYSEKPDFVPYCSRHYRGSPRRNRTGLNPLQGSIEKPEWRGGQRSWHRHREQPLGCVGSWPASHLVNNVPHKSLPMP